MKTSKKRSVIKKAVKACGKGGPVKDAINNMNPLKSKAFVEGAKLPFKAIGKAIEAPVDAAVRAGKGIVREVGKSANRAGFTLPRVVGPKMLPPVGNAAPAPKSRFAPTPMMPAPMPKNKIDIEAFLKRRKGVLKEKGIPDTKPTPGGDRTYGTVAPKK